ncbi:MAG: HEPN domain-containing protein [Treponema sp.]|jgi:HEPN domain-containing protein|nr:HEPN domain-containing protein [Treponema sp.]
MAKHPKQTNTPKDWRLLAERDMAIADHLAATMRPVPSEAIAFHCQQASEKYLKGALVILGEEPPYTHDLDELCSMAERHRPSFVSISSLCTVITHFSVQPRYDMGLSLSEEDMRLVLSHTKTIKDFLLKEIPELFLE